MGDLAYTYLHKEIPRPVIKSIMTALNLNFDP